MTHFVLLFLTTLSGVLYPPVISLQSSVIVETLSASVYNTHVPQTVDQYDHSRGICAFQHGLLFVLLGYAL